MADKPIDTTDQQAVTVAQIDRDAVQAFHRTMLDRLMSDVKSQRPKLGDDEGDAGTLVQAFARHRLASVSSASADYVLVPRDDDKRDLSDSILPAAMIDAGIEVLDKVQIDSLDYQADTTTDWDDGMVAVAVYRAMLAASPEPVPATNQAGEVATAVELLEQYAGFIRDDVKADDLERHPYLPLIEQTIAALATQPATSQEGEVTKADRDLFALIAPDMASLIYGGDLDGFAQMQGIVRHRLAATPTPPTLSENLREEAGILLSRAHGYDEAVQDGDQLHVSKIIDAMVEFARAQGQAS